MIQETKIFLEAVEKELQRATKKFPWPNNNLVALMEEVGELSRAFLDNKSFPDKFNEAVQVAAMAARCALEGDPQFRGER